MRLGDHLTLDGADVSCRECGESIGRIDENLKSGLVVRDQPIQAAGPYYVDPERFVADDVVFREYFCPGCGTRQFTETAQPDDEPLSEVELDPETL